MEQAQPKTPTFSNSLHVLSVGHPTSVWAPTDESKDEERQPTKPIYLGSPNPRASIGGFHDVSQHGRAFETSYRRRIPDRADSFGCVTKNPEIISSGGGKLFAVDAHGEIHESSLFPARRPDFRKRLPLSRTPSVSSGSEESQPESPCYLTSERIKGFQSKLSSIRSPTIHYHNILQDYDKIHQELDKTNFHRHEGTMFEEVNTSSDLTDIGVASTLNQDLRISNLFPRRNLMGLTDNIRYEELTLSMLEARVQLSEQRRLLPQDLSHRFENSCPNNKPGTEVVASGNSYGKLGSICLTCDLIWELIQAAYLTPDSSGDLWENPRQAPSPPAMSRADESLHGNSSDRP